MIFINQYLSLYNYIIGSKGKIMLKTGIDTNILKWKVILFCALFSQHILIATTNSSHETPQKDNIG